MATVSQPIDGTSIHVPPRYPAEEENLKHLTKGLTNAALYPPTMKINSNPPPPPEVQEGELRIGRY